MRNFLSSAYIVRGIDADSSVSKLRRVVIKQVAGKKNPPFPLSNAKKRTFLKVT